MRGGGAVPRYSLRQTSIPIAWVSLSRSAVRGVQVEQPRGITRAVREVLDRKTRVLGTEYKRVLRVARTAVFSPPSRSNPSAGVDFTASPGARSFIVHYAD